MQHRESCARYARYALTVVYFAILLQFCGSACHKVSPQTLSYISAHYQSEPLRKTVKPLGITDTERSVIKMGRVGDITNKQKNSQHSYHLAHKENQNGTI